MRVEIWKVVVGVWLPHACIEYNFVDVLCVLYRKIVIELSRSIEVMWAWTILSKM
jgi:hypothetical protein